MTLDRVRPVVTAAAIAMAALLSSACGVRGPLDPPNQAKAEGDAKSAEAGASGENSAAKPKPHEPFVLDPLLR
jgi:predicted small lipoprotein YifL